MDPSIQGMRRHTTPPVSLRTARQRIAPSGATRGQAIQVDRGKGFPGSCASCGTPVAFCDGRIEARMLLLPPVLRSFGTASERDGLLMQIGKASVVPV